MSRGGRRRKLHRAPRVVIGYHGCSLEIAERVLAGEPFVPSSHSYDWLGEGIYFWEYGPFRAREWAKERYGTEAAVLEATICLGRCLNLLDVEHHPGFSSAYQIAAQNVSGRIPRNTDKGAHFRDQFMIEFYCRIQVEEGNLPYQTVRACFPEGDPIVPESAILSKTHVQLAVRDDTCISRLRLVECNRNKA
jgi:hypothetical protein